MGTTRERSNVKSYRGTRRALRTAYEQGRKREVVAVDSAGSLELVTGTEYDLPLAYEYKNNDPATFVVGADSITVTWPASYSIEYRVTVESDGDDDFVAWVEKNGQEVPDSRQYFQLRQ